MSRQAVLKFLRAHPESCLSGEEMSRTLGLSRTAVWKAVDALRKEGYTIEARSGQGYRLLETPDHLSEAEVRAFLGTPEGIGRKLICLEEIDSTNNYAKQLALSGGEDGTVILAEQQTAGRGRMDRVFASPKGLGIYLTVLLRPDLPPERLMPVTALAGVAVCRAVSEACGLELDLKWPNDPVLRGKKVCGILTELSLEAETGRLQSLVLGIGLNVHQKPEDFPPELREMAASLDQALSEPVSRPRLAAALIRQLDRLHQTLYDGELQEDLEEYRRRCVNLGKPLQLLHSDGSREQVEGLGIDQDFALRVRRADGSVQAVRSGEVSVRGLYGYAE